MCSNTIILSPAILFWISTIIQQISVLLLLLCSINTTTSLQSDSTIKGVHSTIKGVHHYKIWFGFWLVGSGILRICSASSGLKCLWIKGSFHCWFSSIKSATLQSISKVGTENGLNVCGLGIQWLLCTLILSLEPILHLIPLMTFLPRSILLQINEGLDPSLASKKLPFLKYLSWSILAIRDFGYWINNLFSSFASLINVD